MTKVSVLIPAYNAARFIDDALACVTAQSERDLEILVIDDCSSDDTGERVRAAAKADPRIRLLATPRNGGPSAARNVGLEAARGRWVALLDADDTMAPERIATLVALGEAHGAQMVADNLLLVDEGGARPEPMIPNTILSRDQPLSLAEFITRNVSNPSQPRFSYGFMKPIILREFLDRHGLRYDESVRFAEDFALYVRCLRAGANWWITPAPMYRYLVRHDSLTQVQTAGDLDRLRRRQRALLEETDVRGDSTLRRAVQRHLRGIERNYSYRAFTDALKARRVGEAMQVFLETPRSGALILTEVARQAPIVFAKALRGGYGRGAKAGPV